ncbi:MAG TPA: bifunctional metallophosphatase/5'-nucleotidase, partial [Hyphomonadaceae bacterium]|nr:bifunctional metallophosphatase/5'-nucleotidase [Hyphomonadaceae bacterium]
VHLLAINDFHGNLEPPTGGVRIFNPANPNKWDTAPGGGSPRLATAVAELSKRPNTIMVAAGDLIGASPLLSSLFHDEPTIESLSKMGLSITSVGNHEFDEGWKELRRMQDGGCHPVDGCKGPKPFEGAKFEYLAASTFLDNGQTLFPPYTVRTFDGVKVGFIGLTLEGTPDIITPAARTGLTFKDEAETVNALVPKLKAEGVEAIVVLFHEGGFTNATQDDCHGLTGAITEIVPKFDKAVDVVVSGHTNGIYICTLDGRLVTSAGAYGTRITDISLLIDRRSGDIIGKSARDVPIRQDTYAEDPSQVDIIAAYKKQAEPLMIRPVGQIAAEITRKANPAGQSALGGLIADSMLEAARKQTRADIAFMNPGGIRADLPFQNDGQVRYTDIFTVQPFGNDLVVLTLTGAQIETILKQQYQAGDNTILQASEGFSYTWRQQPGKPIEIVPGSMKLDGQPMTAAQSYRVVTNNFLVGGGDSFQGFKPGTDRVTIGGDVEALEAYVKAHSPLAASVHTGVARAD